jgi:LysM repeat protein
MKRSLFKIAFVLCALNATASEGIITRTEYVGQWNATAIQEMIKNGIPASITLAQGILESGSGNSQLARKGNNHFGIKCHGWEGDKMYMDDDKKGECFRVYRHAQDSYYDHSAFLKRYDRYNFLFTYATDDYESWAKGLKKAGYATNPQYPQRLIKIIEEMDLARFDKVSSPEIIKSPNLVVSTSNSQRFSNTHSVKNHKMNVSYVVAEKGDTYYQIAKEFGLTLNQLYRFNDIQKNKDFLNPGDIIYIEQKRGWNPFKKDEVIVQETMSLVEFAQLHAVKAQTIMRLNGLHDEEIVLERGQKITLR